MSVVADSGTSTAENNQDSVQKKRKTSSVNKYLFVLHEYCCFVFIST